VNVDIRPPAPPGSNYLPPGLFSQPELPHRDLFSPRYFKNLALSASSRFGSNSPTLFIPTPPPVPSFFFHQHHDSDRDFGTIKMKTKFSDENSALAAPSTPRALTELGPDDARHSIATIKRSSSQSSKSLVSYRRSLMLHSWCLVRGRSSVNCTLQMELRLSSGPSGSPLDGKSKPSRVSAAGLDEDLKARSMDRSQRQRRYPQRRASELPQRRTSKANLIPQKQAKSLETYTAHAGSRWMIPDITAKKESHHVPNTNLLLQTLSRQSSDCRGS
jgi:hypothetical protein